VSEHGTLALKTGVIPYKVERTAPVRSRRTRYTLDVRAGAADTLPPQPHVVFFAPPKVPEAELVAFGLKHKRWINNRLTELSSKQTKHNELQRLAGKVCELPLSWWYKVAESWILPRTQWWAAIMGEKPAAVHITHTKSRWGSCTRDRVIRFSCHLMQVPEGLRDYIIVHELAHLRQMNHSPKFWREVEKLMPDYIARRRELAKLGRHVL
jgi:predicted metal-dependent hydrolase